MQLLTTSKQINRLFVDLIHEYAQFDWLSAWAGISFHSREAFKSNQHKCRKVIIGTHFFQTHPDFIADVFTNSRVRFIKNTTEDQSTST